MGSIFDNGDLEFLGDLLKRIHVGALAIQMNGQDGRQILWAVRAKTLADEVGVEVECAGIDVHENGRGPGAHDRASRGEEAERGGDNRIARLDSGGHQREPESFGSGGAAGGCSGSGERGDFALEGLDFRTENESLGVADASDRGQNLVAKAIVLAAQIEERDGVKRAGSWCRCGFHAVDSSRGLERTGRRPFWKLRGLGP